MKEKIKKQKGFIQIPLLIVIIVSIVAVSVVATGIVLHKQGKLAPLIASVSQIFEGTEETPAIEEIKSKEPQTEQEPEVISQEELEQAKLEAERAKKEVEEAKAEAERLRKEAEEKQKEIAKQQELEKQKQLAETQRQLEIRRQLEQEELKREQERLQRELLNYVNENQRIVISFLNDVEDIVITHKRNRKGIIQTLISGFNSIIAPSESGDPLADLLIAYNKLLSFEIDGYEEDINWWRDILAEGKEVETNFYNKVSKIIQDTNKFSAKDVDVIISIISEDRDKVFDAIKVAIQKDEKNEQAVLNSLLQIKRDLDTIAVGMPSSDYIRNIQEWLFHQRLLDELRGIKNELQNLDNTLRYYY